MTPPQIAEDFWQAFLELQWHILAHIRYTHEPSGNGRRSYRSLGGISPDPCLYTMVLHKLIDGCQNVMRGLGLALGNLRLPDPPEMPAALCDTNIAIGDSRRDIAFKDALQKLETWTNNFSTAVREGAADKSVHE